MTNEYYNGYFRLNGYKEWIEKVDNEYKFFVNAEHMYETFEEVDLYDNQGKFYKTVKESTQERRRETKEMKKGLQVFQIDYKFYLLPTDYFNTQDEVSDVCGVLNNSNMGNFDVGHHCISDLYMIHSPRSKDFVNDYMKDRINYILNKPFEIVALGNSYWITKNSFKSFINLDIKEYTKSKNDFLKTLDNEYLINRANTIFESNIKAIATFYMTNEKSILSWNFNRVKKSVERLNYNINSKIK